MKLTRLIIATTALAATFVVAAPTAAPADGPSGARFGQHVRVCAQTMGFSGDHNPGMHSGLAGWDGMTCQG